MTISRAQTPILQFIFDGKPVTGGFLYTYDAVTDEKVQTFADYEGKVLNPFKIGLDSSGCTENEVWLDSSMVYKFKVVDRSGNTVFTRDHVTANTQTFSAQGSDTIDVAEEIVDGRIVVTFKVRPNSIGRNELKNTRNFIPDAAYIQFKTFGDSIVVTLCDKLKAWLETEGYVADE